MRVFIFFLLFFFSFCLVKTAAQRPVQTLRGTVTDNASNVPVSYATVILQGTKPAIGTTTDSTGNFVLKNVPVGRYDVGVSMVGYQPAVVNEVQVSSGKETFITISLKEATTELKEVVVKRTISKEHPLNPMASVSAQMLSVEEASRYAGGFDDPARLVSSFAGVASNVGNNGIVVRGNNPKSLQWKLEGVEIPNPNHFADVTGTFGGGGLTALSSQLLANSDFFSGAFPAEYSNALSGVFDIFMRNGSNVKNETTLQAGLIGVEAASEGPFRKGGQSSYLFNYRYSTLALLSPVLPANSGGVRYQDLSFKLNFPTRKAGTFTLWGIGLIDRSGEDAKTDSTQWYYKSDRENEDVKQFMGASGLTHKLFFNEKTYIKSTLAATVSGLDLTTDSLLRNNSFMPQNRINCKNWNFVFNSFVNTKFSARHINKTGIVVTGLLYNMHLQQSVATEAPMLDVVNKTGFSTLLSAYTNSTFTISPKLTANIGINGQLFTLNHHYTIEPRAGITYQTTENQTLSVAYGLHSRLEKINYYFSENSTYENEPVNKNLDFTRAHHVVIGYDWNVSEHHHLKVETYYQYLFRVPVIADSSYSFLNLESDWFFNDKLQNTGKGKNYGVDVTFEKYMSDGYYYMLTASLFNSRYKGGDNIWRNTRFNRNYLFNFLIGKEWQLGASGQNTLGLNIRVTCQGGDRYSPIDTEASLKSKDVIFDETKAFSKQVDPTFFTHFTASYRINKHSVSHEFALKIVNVTSQKEYQGFEYNYLKKTVDMQKEATFIPNLSYKIEF